MTRKTIRQTIAIGTAALILSACSDAAGTTTTTAPETTTTIPAPAEPEPVEVMALDYAYGGIPTEVEAGTSFTLVNTSETELHEFVAIRLDDDETRSPADILSLPPDQLGALFGNVSTVLLAPPSSDEMITAVGDGTLSEPGRYLIICAIPTGADPQEYLEAAATSEGPPTVDGGPPHFTQGMFAEITVTE